MVERTVKIIQVEHGNSNSIQDQLSGISEGDLCFYRFISGNTSDTDRLIKQLYSLKEKNILLLGVFRFPYKFEGKKRLQTAIIQYYRMKELCDAVIYFHSDGMLELLAEGTSIHDAKETFNQIEEDTLLTLRDMILHPGNMNIDLQDIKAFIKNNKGPLYIHSFEGTTFDEPLKYLISAPYLAADFADGQQMIINIGYTRNVDMEAFRQINLRLHDLFHKTELFKLGSYFIDQPGTKIKITLLINGINDPFERPDNMAKLSPKLKWLTKRWKQFSPINKEKWSSLKIKASDVSQIYKKYD